MAHQDLIAEVTKWLGPKVTSPWTLTEEQFLALQRRNVMGVPVVLVMEADCTVSITPIVSPPSE